MNEIECPIHKGSLLVLHEVSLNGYEVSGEYLIVGERTSHCNHSASMVRDHTDRKDGVYKGLCGCEFKTDLSHSYSTEIKGTLHEYALGKGDRRVFKSHN